MSRLTTFVAALALGLAFAIAPTVTFAQAPPAPADAAKTAPKAAAKKAAPTKVAQAKLGPNQKQCKSKQPSGAIKTWTCGKDQPCCVSHDLNLYTCGSQLLKCF